MQAVIYLARHNAAPVLSRRIAEELGIPQHFLAKILQDLTRRGLLQSFKGRGGGFQLARSASAIRLLDVVEAIDGREFIDGCVLGLPECSTESACLVHSQWSLIKARIMTMLGEKSLDELIEDPLGNPWLESIPD
jgi:Rrf2 family protein